MSVRTRLLEMAGVAFVCVLVVQEAYLVVTVKESMTMMHGGRWTVDGGRWVDAEIAGLW